MRDVNRPARGGPDAGVWCIALALGLGTIAVWGPATTARAQTSGTETQAGAEGDDSEERRRWWLTEQWTVGGESIAWKGGWMYVDGAVAIRDGGGTDVGPWRLRAERLELRLAPSSPLSIDAFRARGRVRLVGPPPLYVAGRRAVSFRPGQTLTVWSPAADDPEVRAAGTSPRLVGDGWTLTGERISVDLLDERVTVDGVMTSRRSHRSDAGRRAVVAESPSH